ncbi:MAG: protein kinase [Planctomycetota bacterium]
MAPDESARLGPLPGAPRRLGRFELRGRLGRGAMGEVFLAWDPQAGREVALKTCRKGSSERFVREAKLTAALDHPGIVRVFEAGVDAGLAYYVCELVRDARDLRDAFRTLSLAERVELVRDAAVAVGHAHAQGVVHRDLKPENLLVDAAGALRVADFGLAAAEDQERLTRTGALLGTPTHLAPEQWRALHGERVAIDPRSDVWALGVVLYEALTSELPFEGATWVELCTRILEDAPRPPRALSPEVPRALEAVCLRALARDPGRRPPDGAALAAELEAALAAPEGPVGRAGRVALGAALLGLVGGGLLAARAAAPEAPSRAAPSAGSDTRPEASATSIAAPEPAASAARPAALDPSAALLAEARAAQEARQPERARALVERLLAEAPRDPDALELRALLRAQRDPAGALADLDAALAAARERKQQLHLRARRADLLRALNRREEALREAEQVLALEPGHAETRGVRAILLAERGDTAAALHELDRLVEERPDVPSVWRNRATLRARMDDQQGALLDLGRALELDPQLSAAYSLRSAILLNQGKYEEALHDVERGLELAPRDTLLLSNLVVILLQRRDHAGALRAADLALETTPQSGLLHANRGFALAGLGRPREAAPELSRALELLPATSPQRPRVEATLRQLQSAGGGVRLRIPSLDERLQAAAKLRDAGYCVARPASPPRFLVARSLARPHWG